jgi:hypothetical protein
MCGYDGTAKRIENPWVESGMGVLLRQNRKIEAKMCRFQGL